MGHLTNPLNHQCVSYGLIQPRVPGRVIDSTAYAVEDPTILTAHWGLETCVAASFIDKRVLIFSRNLAFVNSICCDFIQPIGYDDSYTLIEYLPVTDFVTRPNSKQLILEVSCMVPSKYNVGAFENGLSAIVVDVRLGRTLASGHATELLEFDYGTLKFELNTENSSGANYNQFLKMIAGERLDDVVSHPARDSDQAIASMVEHEGLIRLY